MTGKKNPKKNPKNYVFCSNKMEDTIAFQINVKGTLKIKFNSITFLLA
jgi:hypothetical protein